MTRTLACVVSLVVSLSAAACGDNQRAAVPDARPDAPPPAAPALYALESELDLAGTLPGKVGSAVDEIISATDDPDDPTRYLVDKIIARMQAGTLKDVAEAAEPFVTAYVNARVIAHSPQLLVRLIAIGHDLGQAARHLGTMDTLAIAPDGTATHAIVGLRIELDDQVVELGFADHGLGTPSAAVALHRTTGELTLARHALGLSLGRVLRLVVDGAIVPHVDPGAVDLVGVLQGGVDCGAFGSAMASALGFGSADSFAAACRDAITDAATTIYGELDAVDADALELDLGGTARAVDLDGDGRFDELVDGAWTGSVSYAGTPAPLVGGTFSGARVN